MSELANYFSDKDDIVVHLIVLGKSNKFYDISNIISEALSSHDSINNPDLNQILEADKWARRYVNNKISKLI